MDNNKCTQIMNVSNTDLLEYCDDINEYFLSVPEVAKPLLRNARSTLNAIEKGLYTAIEFIDLVRSSVPVETLQAVLTDEQKTKLAEGTLKLMTKKDGSLMANLIDPNTKKIVSTIPLKKVDLAPDLSQAMTSFATQMQMAEIAEQIQCVQMAIEEVRRGQECDRLATAYSCQQKLLQAMSIQNLELKAMALLRIVSDAEDSRNLLMQSQYANIEFIKNQPESFWGKLLTGVDPDKINGRMNEIRDSLSAVNMVSLVEALAYQELGEPEAARQSLSYYADYIQRTYLSTENFVQRLDSIDPSHDKYWSNRLPDIQKKIRSLPCYDEQLLEENHGKEM